MKFYDTWQLDTFFKGGSRSQAFVKALTQWKKNLSLFLSSFKKGKVDFTKAIDKWMDLRKHFREMDAFVLCLTVQNTDDEKATTLQSEVTSLSAELLSATDTLLEALSKLSEKEFHALIKKPQFQGIAYPLTQKRKLFKEKLQLREEVLIQGLSVDGYHGWHEAYSQLMGKMEIPFVKKGKKTTISCAEADGLLSSANREERKLAFECWNKTLHDNSFLFAQLFNHLSGFRLKVYEKRDWEGVLKEPLFYNRIQKESVECMWKVVQKNLQPFVKFLRKKAECSGIKKGLAWYDLDAPLSSSQQKISYEKGSEIIQKSFSFYSDDMARFSEKALTSKWIDAQMRPKKAPGGFCVPFPNSKESRIFMTYSGSFASLDTLAHELGHGYHNKCVFHLPELAQDYPMSLAECASTLAEHMLYEEMLREAKSSKERLSVLHNKAQRSVTFFMNINARFSFECAFYKRRKEGFVPPDEICKIMLDAQKKAFGGALTTYHPYFWASKQHFFFTEVPFYNFPYTVGYFFSLAITAEARRQKKGFEEWYKAFLEDTGNASCEELALRYFGEDLSKERFWQKAMDVAIDDVELFFKECK